jgi:hypothetical protein
MLNFIFFAVACTVAVFAQAATGIYNIGDKGPAGGIVFYDKGEFSDGWRYLEVAPAETEFYAPCGTYGQTVARTNTGIGFGKQNTVLMVEKLKALGESNCAAQLCANLNYGGFSDWFLPSKDELNLMYTVLRVNGLGNFKIENDRANQTHSYLSSSKAHSGYTWGQIFIGGLQSAYKTGSYSVRAIRAF